MKWQDIRKHYPNQWLLVEAIDARSEEDRRIIIDLSVIDVFENSPDANRKKADLQRLQPMREFYVFNSQATELQVTERKWLGLRP